MNDSAKLACCLICTLAAAMKDCKNCPFNPEFLKPALKPVEPNNQKEIKSHVNA